MNDHCSLSMFERLEGMTIALIAVTLPVLILGAML
jgi:hypothetical protein